MNSYIKKYVYTLFCAVYFLTFGVFNSILREYHRTWILTVLFLSIFFLFFYRNKFIKGERENEEMGFDFFTILLIAYVICLLINYSFHFTALQLLEDPIYLNIRLVSPDDWVTANIQFFIYYMYFPVLILFHRYLFTWCNVQSIIRSLGIIISISMIVLYYQVLVDPTFLAKWSKSASYIKPDGLASDPNSYVMCVLLTVPVLIFGTFLDCQLLWRIFFLLLTVFYGISGILTGSRTGIIAIIFLLLSVPIIVSASNNYLELKKRLALIGLPLVILTCCYVFTPFIIKILKNVQLGDGFYRLILTFENLKKYGFYTGIVKDNYRILQYAGALILLWKAPFGGWGPGGFYREFPNEYYLQTGDFTTRNDSALNHFLMISGDLGIPMLILNILIIILPLIAICRVFNKTKEIKERYVLSSLFVTQFIFLFVINTLPPSYFPDVIWVWTAVIAVSLIISQKFGLSFTIKKQNRRFAYAAILLGIVLPNCIGIYISTFGANGYKNRQNELWNPLKFEKNCYWNEQWKEGKVRWCKGKALLKIPITDNKPFPEKVQLKFILLHPDIDRIPVSIKYGGRSDISKNIIISDNSWHTIEIQIRRDDTITLPDISINAKMPFNKYFRNDTPIYAGPELEAIFKNYFFHGYKFSDKSTIPQKGVYKYVVVSFEVSRNWIPKEGGINSDDRELGIAVLIPKL
ncbi:hypothetical protein C4565_05600 [Candidatus Parcubacteria bacterium]|nr:MAG: hypothetical protein C4565_05600 [Candidatus Parcubacteria bacterium]